MYEICIQFMKTWYDNNYYGSDCSRFRRKLLLHDNRQMVKGKCSDYWRGKMSIMNSELMP